MIENVVINGFKSLKNISIQIKPITVLIGLNSSGKSSVLQFLEILKQSAKESSQQLRTAGELINLGSFKDIVSEKDEKNDIQFEINGKRRQFLKSPFEEDTNYSYSASIDKSGIKQYECTIESGKICLRGKYDRDRSCKNVQIPHGHGQLNFDPAFQIGHPFRFGGTSGDMGDLRHGDASAFSDVIEHDLSDFFMVPAIRGLGSPSYPLDSKPSNELMHMQNLYQQAIQLSSTVVYESPAIERKINKWISRITGISIRARTIPDKQAAIEAFRKMDVNIINEGFGSNQLVHMFAQIATSPDYSLIGIEEPEVHLHPKAQSELSKIFIDIAEKEKKNIILTTHSEHVLYRFMIEIAKGNLKSADFALYHFRLSKKGVTIAERLNIDKKGRLDKGIPDFLETDLDEFKDFLEALKS